MYVHSTKKACQETSYQMRRAMEEEAQKKREHWLMLYELDNIINGKKDTEE